MTSPWRSLLDQRGIALPTALVCMILLMGLTVAFTSLATTEPVIARNHTMSAQARALAESGVERAIWAMANAAPTFDVATGVAGSPYNGASQLTVPGGGVFTVRMVNGADPNTEKLVTTVGWAQDNAGQLSAPRRIQVTLTKPPLTLMTPPCALCVAGNLDIGGNSTITSWTGSSGVAHCASAPTGGTTSTGDTTTTGNAYAVYGPGDAAANQAEDMPEGPTNTVPTLTSTDLDTLRALAKSSGTYRQRQAGESISYDNSHLLPAGGGILFVDTVTGEDLDPGPPYSSGTATPSSEWGSVSISGNQTWSGWIIAMGDVDVSGTVSLTGAIYARNDFSFNGNGTITGAVLAENTMKTVQSSVDSSTSGNSRIVYDCPSFQSGGGTVSTKWTVKPGTFVETSGRASY